MRISQPFFIEAEQASGQRLIIHYNSDEPYQALRVAADWVKDARLEFDIQDFLLVARRILEDTSCDISPSF